MTKESYLCGLILCLGPGGTTQWVFCSSTIIFHCLDFYLPKLGNLKSWWHLLKCGNIVESLLNRNHRNFKQRRVFTLEFFCKYSMHPKSARSKQCVMPKKKLPIAKCDRHALKLWKKTLTGRNLKVPWEFWFRLIHFGMCLIKVQVTNVWILIIF